MCGTVLLHVNAKRVETKILQYFYNKCKIQQLLQKCSIPTPKASNLPIRPRTYEEEDGLRLYRIPIALLLEPLVVLLERRYHQERYSPNNTPSRP